MTLCLLCVFVLSLTWALGAIGRAARRGSIIKGGLHLEVLAEIDTVLLNKTGTLTYGTPQIREVLPSDGWTERQVVAAASIAERRSEHPLAKAILDRAAELAIPSVEPDHFAYTPGRGVIAHYKEDEIIVGNRAFLEVLGVSPPPSRGMRAGGATEVFVVHGRSAMGSIHITDVLRAEAKHAALELKQTGLEVVLLSGDAQNATDAVGEELGVNKAVGELLPEAKARWVSDLCSQGRKVAMVGDGINDAPVLVKADVGIAMGSGTDVARESADVILIGNDLNKLVDTLRIARRCHRTIMENFWGTLVVDGVGVVLAALGFLNPLLAAFIHVSSELAFILNSARLLPSAKLRGRLVVDKPSAVVH